MSAPSGSGVAHQAIEIDLGLRTLNSEKADPICGGWRWRLKRRSLKSGSPSFQCPGGPVARPITRNSLAPRKVGDLSRGRNAVKTRGLRARKIANSFLFFFIKPAYPVSRTH